MNIEKTIANWKTEKVNANELKAGDKVYFDAIYTISKIEKVSDHSVRLFYANDAMLVLNDEKITKVLK